MSKQAKGAAKAGKVIIGNWKMKKGLAESAALAKEMVEKFRDFNEDGKVVAICPTLVALTEVDKIVKKSNLKLGAQNVFWEDRGSYTGEVSPQMLIEAGCRYVIIGHSERRKYLLENYSMIHQKVREVLNAEGLVPVVCIGEENEDRKTDRRDFVLLNQLQQALGGIDISESQRIIVAYEPVWAIGSGTAIEPSEATYAHKIIRLALDDMFGMQAVEKSFQIIYGGSVTGKNVKSFSNLENMDGFLVGGASLDAEEFYKICKGI
ncbi:MAG: triose-phosphate isomerase [Patescibacteria group bacterium]|nr:triose-phosphate isomerase [Patescibacteria group bacterium]